MRLGRWLLVLALLLAAGCELRPERIEEELSPSMVIRLAAPVGEEATLWMDPHGRAWIGSAQGLRVVDPRTAATLTQAELQGRAVPRVVAEGEEGVYVRIGDHLLALDRTTLEIRAQRQERATRPVAVDPRQRYLYVGTETGAVFGLDPRSLQPLWAWPRLGLEATALTSSPEADRLYLALWGAAEEGEGAARILTRDVQTGRVLGTISLVAPLRTLTTDAAGVLYGVAGDEARGAVVALRPTAEGLRILWRRALRDLDPPARPQLQLAPDGQRLALFAPGEEGGVSLVDTRTGERRGRVRETPLDLAFGTNGELYLLYAEEMRVVR